MRTRGVRRAPLVAVTICAGLMLSGCGALPPGAASVVEGTTISQSDVEELTEAQCAGIEQAAEGGEGAPEQAAPRKQLVQQALSLLMDIELSLQYAESEDLAPRPEAVASIYAQVDPLIQSLPERYQPFMEDTFQRWAQGRDVLTQVGERETGQAADGQNGEALLNAGYQAREPWLGTIDIDTDPRYGPSDAGWPGGGDPSVSKASSSFAKAASKAQPDPAWVGELPLNQKCGG